MNRLNFKGAKLYVILKKKPMIRPKNFISLQTKFGSLFWLAYKKAFP